MLDYEYIFATELHKKLKPRIKGKIYVCITKHNELSVKINNLNLEYEYLSENKFSDMVLNGYSTTLSYSLFAIPNVAGEPTDHIISFSSLLLILMPPNCGKISFLIR